MSTEEVACEYAGARPSRRGVYCEALGPCGGFLGTEEGCFEGWIWPLRLVHDLQVWLSPAEGLVLNVEPLQSALIEFEDFGLRLIYSAPLATVRQVLAAAPDRQVLLVLLEVHAYRPVLVGLSFRADLVPMWPGSLGGRYTLWDEERNAYVLTEGRKKFAGIVGGQGARRLSELAAHEPPGSPLRLAFEAPGRSVSFFPVLLAASLEGIDAARKNYEEVASDAHGIVQRAAESRLAVRRQQARLRGSSSFAPTLEAAGLALHGGLVRNPQLGEALVAGFGLARETYRPGFAWFFGGDAVMNSWALNVLGDPEPVRKSLRFFAKHAREDGRIAHEISQAAGMLDWYGEYPYAFIHADTTPYFILGVADYVSWSGDLAFLREVFPAVRKAYEYCLPFDSDGDGLIENAAAGLGALELGSLLQNIHVDIYLASVWTKALGSLAWMAGLLGETDLHAEARKRFEHAKTSLNLRFWNPVNRRFEFAILQDGMHLHEPTAWSTMPLALDLADQELVETVRLLASSELNTDWGVRMLSRKSEHYDPVGYNNGAVWPFLTGLTVWGLYRAHHAPAAFQKLEALAQLHFDFSYGLAHEVFSGEFYQPLQASVPHQLFSSSALAYGLLRGLFGIEADVPGGTLRICPHLPPDWNGVSLEGIPFGRNRMDLQFVREEQVLRVRLPVLPEDLREVELAPAVPVGAEIQRVKQGNEEVPFSLTRFGRDQHVRVLLRPERRESVEVELAWSGGVGVSVPRLRPQIGDATRNLLVLDYALGPNSLRILAEAPAGSERRVRIQTPWQLSGGTDTKIRGHSDGAWEVDLRFPDEGERDYVRREFVLRLQGR